MMHNNEIGLMLDGFRYDIGRDRQTSHDTTYLCATITNKETYIVPRFRQLQGGNLGKETAEVSRGSIEGFTGTQRDESGDKE